MILFISLTDKKLPATLQIGPKNSTQEAYSTFYYIQRFLSPEQVHSFILSFIPDASTRTASITVPQLRVRGTKPLFI